MFSNDRMAVEPLIFLVANEKQVQTNAAERAEVTEETRKVMAVREYAGSNEGAIGLDASQEPGVARGGDAGDGGRSVDQRRWCRCACQIC
jgi:hypothetical protein